VKPGKLDVPGLDILMHVPHETDTERRLRNVIGKQREAVRMLEQALRDCAAIEGSRIAPPVLGKLQEMRG
jgi:hypothetical protein